LRVLEPLGARLELEDSKFGEANASPREGNSGVAVHFDSSQRGSFGPRNPEQVDLEIAAGAHVGIVGESGAGKSSLVGFALRTTHARIGRVCGRSTPDIRHGKFSAL